MPLESAAFISELNPLWPLGTDGVNTSDDHHRNTKTAVQQSFPNITKEVTSNSDDLNLLAGGAVNGSGLNPVGTRLEGFWATAPDGYLACDGAVINALFTELIALVGPNTPDERGRFSRGWSVDNTVDPDGPRAPLDEQDDAFEIHAHDINQSDAPGNSEFRVVRGGGLDNTIATLEAGSATETRPKNIAVLVVIKW